MLDAIASLDNLLTAFRQAAKGKRKHPGVAAFELRLEENLWDLRGELEKRTYRPQPYESFYIHEPKRRLISAAPFRDRVVHHALCNVIEPLFEKRFIYDSYANRTGKGTHAALARAQEFARRFSFVLQCDVRQFFASVDHEILRNVLRRTITDNGAFWLVDQILDTGVGVLGNDYRMIFFPGDNLFAVNRPRGLPIGNLTSQIWANCCLDPFDHFVKRRLRCRAYLRYLDDFLLFSNSRLELKRWLKEIRNELIRFRLAIHSGAHARPVSEGFPFLGFVVYPQRRRLKRRKGLNFRRKLKAMAQDYRDGVLPIEKINASVQGWVNHVRFANTVGLRKAVFRDCRLSPVANPKRVKGGDRP